MKKKGFFKEAVTGGVQEARTYLLYSMAVGITLTAGLLLRKKGRKK